MTHFSKEARQHTVFFPFFPFSFPFNQSNNSTLVAFLTYLVTYLLLLYFTFSHFPVSTSLFPISKFLTLDDQFCETVRLYEKTEEGGILEVYKDISMEVESFDRYMKSNDKEPIQFTDKSGTLQQVRSNQLLYLRDLQLEAGTVLSKKFHKDFKLKEALPAGD